MEERHPLHWTRIVEWTFFILFLIYVILLIVSVRAIARREVNTPEDFANEEFGKFLDIEGDQIYYEYYKSEKAEAENVAFIHGFGASSNTWASQIQYFRNNFNVLLIDLPGFGRSQDIITEDLNPDVQARIINQVFRKLGMSSVNLVGHSMGGGIAMRYALTFPERVDKIVLLAPMDLTGGTSYHSLAWLNNPLLAQVPVGLFLNRENLASFAYRAYGDDSQLTSELLESRFEPFTIEGATTNLLRIFFSTISDRSVETGRVKNEILMLNAELEEIIPYEMTENLIRGISNLTHYTLPGLGHVLHEEDPVTVNPIVADFLLEETVTTDDK